MKKIESATLEDALTIAAREFNCSVVDLEYEIIQNPSKGFLGIGKKNAIICAQQKLSAQDAQESQTKAEPKARQIQTEFEHFEAEKKPKKAFCNDELENIAKSVQAELKELLSYLPYKLDKIEVTPYDENTLFVMIDGEDSALLIGKEGYRYKAISYLIFNWINHAYGLMIRLEVAEFLKNQEEMIANYLLPTIESIKTLGKAQTKPLDGVLAHIALKQLREQFPDKYISFRLNSEGERYIIINDFYH